jgi:two-component system response regulator NreC
VRSILERNSDFKVIASVGDGSAAIHDADRLQPDVVVMDITMPGVSGIDAARAITKKRPEIGVIMLSMHSSPIIVRRAIEAGARGYLLKECGEKEIIQGVRVVAVGDPYFDPGLSRHIVSLSRSPRKVGLDELTPSEQTILKLAAEGRSNPEIAAKIGLSRRTVETYRLRLMRKLAIDTFASLIHYAIRHGIIPLE